MITTIFAIILTVVFAGHATGSPTIIWSGEQNIVMGTVGPDFNPGYGIWHLDMNQDGVPDFTFNFVFEPFLVQPFNDNQTVVRPIEGLPTLTESAVLGSGTIIESVLLSPLSWSNDEKRLVSWVGFVGYDHSGAGPWYDVWNQYLGVSFDINGHTHYGWIEMSVSGEQPYGIIHSWAYESRSGVGIDAGVVPEPSTTGLLVVGIGCLGAGAVRRRRKGISRARKTQCQERLRATR